MELSFTVFGPPVPCARARVVGVKRRGRARVRAFTPDRTAEYEQLVRLVAMGARSRAPWWRTDWGAYRLELVVYREARRGDWDNLGKAVSDGLEGVLFDNDGCITDGHVVLELDPERPRVDVTVAMLGDASSGETRRQRRRARGRQGRNARGGP